MNSRTAVAVLAAVTGLSSQLAYAVCGYEEPAVSQSVDDLGLDPNAFSPQAHSLSGVTSVVCTITGTPPNPPGGSQDNWSLSQTLVFANATDFEVPWVRGNKTCTVTPQDGTGLSGSKTCPYDDVTGVHAKLKTQGNCGGQCGYHLGPYVYSNEVLFPPGIEELTANDGQLRYPRPADAPVMNTSLTLDTIPLNYPFAMWGIHAYPAPGDVFTVHVEGAGIHFSQVYGPNLRSDGKPEDVGLLWYQDDANWVTATQEGEIQYWGELNGAKSVVRTLHAVAWSNGYPNGQAPATGGGSGSNNNNDPGTTPPSCSTTGGLELALVAVLLRRKRSARAA